jgi:putative aminopeptidase FrvX
MDYSLLKTLCTIPATAGDEGEMTEFLLKFFSVHSKSFKTMPKVYSGPGFQDMVIAVFGEPRTAIFAHTDTVGYCVAHGHELFKVGNPKATEGTKLQGYKDGVLEGCTLRIHKAHKGKKKGEVAVEKYHYEGKANYTPGTPLTYVPEWKETKQYLRCAYMDNRLGVWNALQQAYTLEHGALVFSTYEETSGGAAQFAGRFLQENFGVQQALISDVTLLGKYIKHRKGVAISMRDRGIPRQAFVRHIISLAKEAGINYQLEVENAGGSDGISLQNSSYAWDWCFIGPPEDHYHQPGEKVAKTDVEAMVQLYEVLMAKL